jgi:hypothetical protein
MTALHPLLIGLVRAVMPICAERGLAEEIATAVSAQLDSTAPAVMTLHVSPENVEAMQTRFEGRLTVEADESLGPAAARLDWPRGGAAFDADATLAAATAAIESFFGDNQKQGLRDAG